MTAKSAIGPKGLNTVPYLDVYRIAGYFHVHLIFERLVRVEN